MKTRFSKSTKLIALLLGISSTSAFARHNFTVCYYNWSDNAVRYDNNGASKNWESRGELTGNGILEPKTGKCFYNVRDETMFKTDYITFNLDGKEIGIANPGLSRPYAIASNGGVTRYTKKDSYLPRITRTGHDNYSLNVHILPGNSMLLSGSGDPKNTAEFINPRKIP